MNDFMEMLKAHTNEEEKVPTPPDVLAHTLKEICARYSAGNPFKRGDLVTPRAGYGVKDEGRPHIVLDVFWPTREIPAEYHGGDARWPDMRVVCESRGDIVTFLGESWTYEKYQGPIAQI